MITYPVDPASRWCSYNTQTGQIEGGRRKKWPTADGMAPPGQAAHVVMLREVEAEQPTYDPQTHTLRRAEAPVIDVQANTATTVWELVARPLEDQIASIKTAARDKILSRWPEWKQQNMTARAVELQEKRLSGGTLTEGEEGELTALAGVWALIKSIRAHSDALETAAQNGQPYDITAPWPGDA